MDCNGKAAEFFFGRVFLRTSAVQTGVLKVVFRLDGKISKRNY